jgi:hypothetical protein
LIASIALISFLTLFNQYFNFELFTQAQRLFYLTAAVIGSLTIYFGASFLMGVRPADFK